MEKLQIRMMYNSKMKDNCEEVLILRTKLQVTNLGS